MGKRGKKQRQPQWSRGHKLPGGGHDDGDCDVLPSSAYDLGGEAQDGGVDDGVGVEEVEEQEEEGEEEELVGESPSKFLLYQKSVQSPKGDISYMQKFFLMYVGGRMPLHLQEDFCGTALLSTEWLRTDSRRTAVGLDLDLEALNWCLDNNVSKIGFDGYSRIFLFHGNVLQPQEACFVTHKFQDLMKSDQEDCLDSYNQNKESESSMRLLSAHSGMEFDSLPARDIVCAFNYSCCCLHRRTDLVSYFKHAHDSLSRKGGIFVMDVYGGTSAEHKLRLQRRFSNFTYIWEQADFDIINRKTRISLHFQLGKKQMLRHAFSYSWRLWSLPEIKDCLEEAGFGSVHVWIREMPSTQESENLEEYNADRDVKYEELTSFQQRDAWNAYVIGVANC